MKKLITSLTFVAVTSAILSGCVDFEPYVGKQLNPEARGDCDSSSNTIWLPCIG